MQADTQMEIAEPPLGEFEHIEQRLADLAPSLAGFSNLCGTPLDRDNLAEVFGLCHETLDAFRVKLWKAEDAARGVLAEKFTVAEVVANHPLKIIRESKRQRRGHELAQRTILDAILDDDATAWKLVEGYWRGVDRGQPFYVSHSWLESGTVVYDAVENLYIDREAYRARFGAFGVKEYEAHDAIFMMSKMEYHDPLTNYGPHVLPLEDGSSPKPLFRRRIAWNGIALTAEEWWLSPDNDSDDEEPTYNEAAAAAKALNEAFNGALARGLGERETRHTMLDLMEQLGCGASDTESRHVLGELLIERFGEEVCEASGWNAWNNFGGPHNRADRERWHKEKRAN